MAAAEKTVLLPTLPSKRALRSVDTASKVGPDSYEIAAPSMAALSRKAAPWKSKVALRTKSPPPDAEAVAMHAVMLELARERVPTRRESPPPLALWFPAVQRAMVTDVSSIAGGN